MTTRIELAAGRHAIVDDADAELVLPFHWVSLRSGSNLYARSRVAPGSERRQLMHRLITGWVLVDHLNGNGLDNRRENLRPATRSQNMGNRRKVCESASKYKGVSTYDITRWKSKIGYEGRQIHLGVFDDEISAAMAYDTAARQIFGEYAALNFPLKGECSALSI